MRRPSGFHCIANTFIGNNYAERAYPSNPSKEQEVFVNAYTHPRYLRPATKCVQVNLHENSPPFRNRTQFKNGIDERINHMR